MAQRQKSIFTYLYTFFFFIAQNFINEQVMHQNSTAASNFFTNIHHMNIKPMHTYLKNVCDSQKTLPVFSFNVTSDDDRRRQLSTAEENTS